MQYRGGQTVVLQEHIRVKQEKLSKRTISKTYLLYLSKRYDCQF